MIPYIDSYHICRPAKTHAFRVSITQIDPFLTTHAKCLFFLTQIEKKLIRKFTYTETATRSTWPTKFVYISKFAGFYKESSQTIFEIVWSMHPFQNCHRSSLGSSHYLPTLLVSHDFCPLPLGACALKSCPPPQQT